MLNKLYSIVVITYLIFLIVIIKYEYMLFDAVTMFTSLCLIFIMIWRNYESRKTKIKRFSRE